MEQNKEKEKNILIGKNIREYREMRQKTQADLAKELGVTAYVIGLIENGRLGLSSEELRKVTNFLDITSEEILAEKKAPPARDFPGLEPRSYC